MDHTTRTSFVSRIKKKSTMSGMHHRERTLVADTGKKNEKKIGSSFSTYILFRNKLNPFFCKRKTGKEMKESRSGSHLLSSSNRRQEEK